MQFNYKKLDLLEGTTSERPNLLNIAGYVFCGADSTGGF